VDRTRANSTITTALLVAAVAVALFAFTFFVAIVYIG
jgi:phosphosulfolactate phosphohydrolase-like enzyme